MITNSVILENTRYSVHHRQGSLYSHGTDTIHTAWLCSFINQIW